MKSYVLFETTRSINSRCGAFSHITHLPLQRLSYTDVQICIFKNGNMHSSLTSGQLHLLKKIMWFQSKAPVKKRMHFLFWSNFWCSLNPFYQCISLKCFRMLLLRCNEKVWSQIQLEVTYLSHYRSPYLILKFNFIILSYLLHQSKLFALPIHHKKILCLNKRSLWCSESGVQCFRWIRRDPPTQEEQWCSPVT